MIPWMVLYRSMCWRGARLWFCSHLAQLGDRRNEMAAQLPLRRTHRRCVHHTGSHHKNCLGSQLHRSGWNFPLEKHFGKKPGSFLGLRKGDRYQGGVHGRPRWASLPWYRTVLSVPLNRPAERCLTLWWVVSAQGLHRTRCSCARGCWHRWCSVHIHRN